MYLFLVSLHVNDAIRKTHAQTIQNFFIKKGDLGQFLLIEKGILNETFNFEEMKIFRHFK